ncbi:hypothetical protein IKP13_03640 [bacterium]|nr:hypothetical protein [bacterium]
MTTTKYALIITRTAHATVTMPIFALKAKKRGMKSKGQTKNSTATKTESAPKQIRNWRNTAQAATEVTTATRKTTTIPMIPKTTARTTATTKTAAIPITKAATISASMSPCAMPVRSESSFCVSPDCLRASMIA